MKRMILILIFLPWYLLFGQQRYNVFVDSLLVEKSRDILFAQLGVREAGRNRGEMVDVYNKVVGLPLGSPYCQAGQYYCYWKASRDLGRIYNNYPVPRNGMAISTFYLAKRTGEKSKYEASVDAFIVWKHREGASGHIERIIGVMKKGWVKTIGFNTGSQSQDDGEGVFEKKRNIHFPLTRIKFILGIVGIIKK